MENVSGLHARIAEIEQFLLSKSALFQPAQKELEVLRQRDAEAEKQGKVVHGVNIRQHFAEPVKQCMAQLRARWPDEEQLRIRVAEMYFHPALWGKGQQGKAATIPVAYLIGLVLTEFVHHSPPKDLVARTTARLDHIFRNVPGKWEDEAHLISGSALNSGLIPAEPGVYDCLDLLLSMETKAADVFEKLANGTFGPLTKESAVGDQKQRKTVSQAIQTSVYDTHWPAVLGYLYMDGKLTYDLFKRAVERMPGSLQQFSLRTLASSRTPAEAVPALIRYGNQLARELSENLSEENLALLLQTRDSGTWLEGSWCLVQAARLFEKLKPKILTYDISLFYPPYRAEMAIVHLAQARSSGQQTAEEHSAAVAELRQLRPATLKALLPLCPRQYPLLLEALGWETAIPLLDAICRLSELEREDGVLRYSRHRPSTFGKPLPEQSALRKLIEATGSDRAREILTLLIDRCPQAEDVAMQVAAIGGLNANEVLDAISSRNQSAVRALGLLPVTRESDALERYQILTQFAETSRQQNPAQRDSELLAADIGVLHLAKSAGYADTRRLRSVMEAAAAGAQDIAGKHWRIKDSEMAIVVTDDGPVPRFSLGGKQVKTVPSVFQATKMLVEMHELLDATKNQHNRLRTWFEEMMCSGECLSLEDMRRYQRSPLAMSLLERLVIAVGDEQFGMVDGSDLKDERGSIVSAASEPVLRVAHAYDLHRAGKLPAWQEEIVRRRRLQPFDQVFRLFYVPSGKEREALQTERFSDITVSAAAAVSLLERCGWQIKRSDVTEIRKIDRRLLVAAVWDSEEASRLLDVDRSGPKIPNEPIAMQGVSFYRVRSGDVGSARNQNVLRLAEVPPIFFSEVMRNIGLVVAETSEEFLDEQTEARQRRIAAVKAILAAMKIASRGFEGDMLTIKGQLATYRINLDGEILSGKSKKVSIPKSCRAEEKSIFVPFANTAEERDEIAVVQGIVNAARLLSNHDAIQDKALLKALGIRSSKSSRTVRTKSGTS